MKRGVFEKNSFEKTQVKAIGKLVAVGELLWQKTIR